MHCICRCFGEEACFGKVFKRKCSRADIGNTVSVPCRHDYFILIKEKKKRKEEKKHKKKKTKKKKHTTMWKKNVYGDM